MKMMPSRQRIEHSDRFDCINVLPLGWVLKYTVAIMMQVQARLQRKTKEEKTLDELTAQHVQDTHVLHEQLKQYKKQMRAAEQMIKDKDKRIAKQQSKMKKNEESVAHMKELLAQKGLETRDELLREIDRQKRLAQDADEKAAVGLF